MQATCCTKPPESGPLPKASSYFSSQAFPLPASSPRPQYRLGRREIPAHRTGGGAPPGHRRRKPTRCAPAPGAGTRSGFPSTAPSPKPRGAWRRAALCGWRVASRTTTPGRWGQGAQRRAKVEQLLPSVRTADTPKPRALLPFPGTLASLGRRTEFGKCALGVFLSPSCASSPRGRCAVVPVASSLARADVF